MSVNFQIIQASDLEDIISFEQDILAQTIPDEVERMMQVWKSRWRKESLDHYLPLGWSFIARDSTQKVVGYFLAQPLLFFDGNTQTLWVEHIQAASEDVLNGLSEIAYKLSREKHFQKVLFPQNLKIPNSESWNPQMASAWTTKVSR